MINFIYNKQLLIFILFTLYVEDVRKMLDEDVRKKVRVKNFELRPSLKLIDRY